MPLWPLAVYNLLYSYTHRCRFYRKQESGKRKWIIHDVEVKDGWVVARRPNSSVVAFSGSCRLFEALVRRGYVRV